RAQKKRIANPPTPPPSSPTPSKPPPNNPRPLASKPPTLSPLPTLTMPPTTPYALLVASLGNPGTAYAHTFHSAGHIVTTHISTTKSYEPFTKGLSGLVSRPSNTTLTFGFLGFRKGRDNTSPEEDDWTFWQSTSLMNVSGPPLRRAWTEFSRGVKARGREPRLVVVHDELEAALGRVGVKDGGSSARGHNGLKSVQGALGVGTKWWRIGVGIGRPESREARVVSEYVLKKMSAREVGAVEKACVGVVEALREIGEGRR
ncbi:peptidyl-tRNA hydrolase, partial [Byssothecium circinans]